MKPNDLVTVVTTTIADSAGHLSRMMEDLRLFTKIPFQQIVSDDGCGSTPDVLAQRRVCDCFGATWTENPGPVWGLPRNLNHAFSLVTTPWAFVIEDGLRSSHGWLETAIDALERLGNREWLGHKVGAIGTTNFQHWELAMGRCLPGKPSVNDMWEQDQEVWLSFWGSERHPNWNDGFWCWKRMEPAMREYARSDEAWSWPTLLNPYRDTLKAGGRPCVGWPQERKVTSACGSGPWVMVNMDAWRAVGRWRDNCAFFEGHLGYRMALAGYLWLYIDFPPFLHYGGMSFRKLGSNLDNWRQPRPYENTDGDNDRDLLYKDFGCNGQHHQNVHAHAMSKHFHPEKKKAIDDLLSTETLYMTPEWEQWL